MSDAGKGALYGSVIPGMGTAIGAGIGSFFGHGGGGGTPADPTADQWQTQDQINSMWNKISGGQYQFGTNDKPATIIKDYQTIYGRNPTPVEIEAALPAAQQGQGGAFIAQLYQNEQNSPANLYAKQQKQWAAAAQTPEIQGSISQLFKSLLNRSATQDELSHYGTLLASGQTDAYTLGQFIQSLPEYQNAQDTQFRQGLDTELQKSDQNFFNQVSPQISQQYAMMGRPTSPAVSVAMTDLAAQLSNNRQNYLSQLSASQYGGNKANALANYGNSQANVQNQISGNTNALYNQYQGMNQRSNQISDYGLQQQNWMNAMNKYGNNTSPLSYLNTAFNGLKGVGGIASLFA
jgi:hypothetical protein